MDDNAMLVWKESNKQFHLRKIKAENEERKLIRVMMMYRADPTLCVRRSFVDDDASLLAWPGTVAREKGSAREGGPGGQGIKHGVDTLEYSIDRSRSLPVSSEESEDGNWKRFAGSWCGLDLVAAHVESRRRWRARSQIFPSWLYRIATAGFSFSHGRGTAQCGPSPLSLSHTHTHYLSQYKGRQTIRCTPYM